MNPVKRTSILITTQTSSISSYLQLYSQSRYLFITSVIDSLKHTLCGFQPQPIYKVCWTKSCYSPCGQDFIRYLYIVTHRFLYVLQATHTLVCCSSASYNESNTFLVSFQALLPASTAVSSIGYLSTLIPSSNSYVTLSIIVMLYFTAMSCNSFQGGPQAD